MPFSPRGVFPEVGRRLFREFPRSEATRMACTRNGSLRSVVLPCYLPTPSATVEYVGFVVFDETRTKV